MDEAKKKLKGSPSRDGFKQKHKELNPRFYASDLDFVLVEKTPIPDIVAAIDHKQPGDSITFSEVITYNALLRRGIPVYICSGIYEHGVFDISRYEGGHHRQPTYRLSVIMRTENWNDYEVWELSLRQGFCDRWQ